MKKAACLLLVCLMLLPMFSMFALAEEEDDMPDVVYLTISNQYGAIVIYYHEILLEDADGDGVTTVYDALYAAHEATYSGGAMRGFASNAQHDELLKLWGYNRGPFGCYVNHESTDHTMGARPKPDLTVPVKDGDYICAFVYRDDVTFSDTYSFFDMDTVTLQRGQSVTLTLRGYVVDENWEVQTVTIPNATIVIDGEDKPYVTDENGQVTLSFSETDEYTVSAKSRLPDGQFLVSAVCHVVQEGVTIAPIWWVVLALGELAFVGAMVYLFLRMQKKSAKDGAAQA